MLLWPHEVVIIEALENILWPREVSLVVLVWWNQGLENLVASSGAMGYSVTEVPSMFLFGYINRARMVYSLLLSMILFCRSCYLVLTYSI